MSKSTGKKIFTVAGFFMGSGHWGMKLFGTTSSIVGGLYGASLVGTIWGATHKDKQAAQTYNFDALQNSIDATAMIPIIYGTRKWGGYQTW
ncbi:hypothetical protein [Anaerosinus massiliensis]|uniref:hypothetical protein n=1 Tax=Massilibacillus massiliensis TaxID=1806837 RepID=UPI000DA6163A|nr:hypothetical protein [Massilibacillus massiliensis]